MIVHVATEDSLVIRHKNPPAVHNWGEKEGGPEVIFPVSDLARLPKPDHC